MQSTMFFSEPAVDVTYSTLPAISENGVRFLPLNIFPDSLTSGADSCEQGIQILTQGERCKIKNARIYIVDGKLRKSELDALKSIIINPGESREASLEEVTNT
jgi:phosphoribosylformylglycinamidine synthase